MFRSLYDRALDWSRHRHARRYLAILSFFEAVFFPIPPDVMLAPMVLAERRAAWRLALLTTLASVAGGLFGYLIGWLAFEAVAPLIERSGQEAAYQAAVDAFGNYGVIFVVLAAFTPIPFKIVTVAAGALLMPLPGFVIGALIGRGMRFFLVAAIIWAGGERAADYLREWVDAIGWIMVVLVIIGGIIWWLW